MPHLENFQPAEFNRHGDWFPRCATGLLHRMDVLRFQLGSPVYISPVDGAVGRRNGQSDKSQHNINYYGEVRAVDFFAPGVDPQVVVDVMRELGFTGIGVYADGEWKGEKATRYHGDVRHDHKMGSPAEWGQVKGRTVSIDDAIANAVY